MNARINWKKRAMEAEEKAASNELSGEVVILLRQAANRITGGNCWFVDDDLAILTHLAQRAIDAGLTDKLSKSVQENIAKKQAKNECTRKTRTALHRRRRPLR